jgi:choline dehydrogenase-like flavoprotein
MGKGLYSLVEKLDQPVDVQSTTLSIDVMGRYVCSTWDEAVDNGGPPFDAVVIGSGMFGGYCAEKIFRMGERKGLRVLVLEAGPFLAATHLQNLPKLGLYEPPAMFPNDDNGKPRNLVWGMPWRSNEAFVGEAYCVGGKSLYWGGWCPRLLEDDLKQWPKQVAAYLRQNYQTLERQTGVSEVTSYIQGDLFKALKAKALAVQAKVPHLDLVADPPLAVEGTSPASGLFSFDKYSSATLLVDAVRQAVGDSGNNDAARRLFLVPNAHVIRLVRSGEYVTEVQVSYNGVPKSLAIAPKCAVVLALGTIESTRMALLSFPRWCNPDDPKELMGRNLMAHVRDNFLIRIKRSALDPNGHLPKLLQTAALLLRGSTKEGKFHVQVTASADMDKIGQPGDPDRLLYTMIPDIDQVDQILASQKADWISFWFRGVSQMKGDRDTPVGSDKGSWIKLTKPEQVDENRQRRALVQIKADDKALDLAEAMDQTILNFAKKLANDNAKDIEIVPIQPNTGGKSIVDGVRDGMGTTYHEAGTLWMGEDPKTSVTDVNGRFHHIANVYCCDQALFPTVGSVNPTLTGLTLARKVAEAIV